jgi:hypothetical protein
VLNGRRRAGVADELIPKCRLDPAGRFGAAVGPRREHDGAAACSFPPRSPAGPPAQCHGPVTAKVVPGV